MTKKLQAVEFLAMKPGRASQDHPSVVVVAVGDAAAVEVTVATETVAAVEDMVVAAVVMAAAAEEEAMVEVAAVVVVAVAEEIATSLRLCFGSKIVFLKQKKAERSAQPFLLFGYCYSAAMVSAS